jgi:hypothetical protein
MKLVCTYRMKLLSACLLMAREYKSSDNLERNGKQGEANIKRFNY